jgi:hypothetical protein
VDISLLHKSKKPLSASADRWLQKKNVGEDVVEFNPALGVVSTLISTGTISKADIIGAARYTLADGSLSNGARLRIHTLKVQKRGDQGRYWKLWRG